MNLQQFLTHRVATSNLNLIPAGLNWLFVANDQREELLVALKEAGLVDESVSDLDSALESLEFGKVDRTAPTREEAYELPSYIDIQALAAAHRLA